MKILKLLSNSDFDAQRHPKRNMNCHQWTILAHQKIKIFNLINKLTSHLVQIQQKICTQLYQFQKTQKILFSSINRKSNFQEKGIKFYIQGNSSYISRKNIKIIYSDTHSRIIQENINRKIHKTYLKNILGYLIQDFSWSIFFQFWSILFSFSSLFKSFSSILEKILV